MFLEVSLIYVTIYSGDNFFFFGLVCSAIVISLWMYEDHELIFLDDVDAGW